MFDLIHLRCYRLHQSTTKSAIFEWKFIQPVTNLEPYQPHL